MGAIVEGQVVKNLVSTLVVDGTTYVPLKYFRDILGENVSLGQVGNENTIVRIYSKEYNEGYIYKKINEYEKPITPEDAVSMYAEAVKERSGIVQYGLMTDILRKEKYDQFKDMGFVTGTSSPWVDSYEILQLEEKVYQIVFTLKTSVPTDTFTSVVKVELVEDSQYISIRDIKEDF